MTSNLSQETIEKLDRNRNRATRYEVVALHPDGRKIRIGFTRRRSKAGMVDLVARKAEWLISEMKLPREARMWHGAGATIRIEDWTASFTGKTYRDAILAGEV